MKKHSKFTRKILLITLLPAISCLSGAQSNSSFSDIVSASCSSHLGTNPCNSDANNEPHFLASQTDFESLSVSLEELDEVRGLGGVIDVSNVAHLEAILTDNYISGSVTGNNSIDTGSFNDASGVFSIIQNTGNNVIIQDSTIITITITPN